MQINKKANYWIPAILILLAIILVILAPEEKEIAAGIKPVYVHVSLTWTAMLLFLILGLMGIINMLKNSQSTNVLLQNIFSTALLFHFAGLIMSFVSSYVNWGGVRIDEARYQTTIYVLILGGISFLTMKLIEQIRYKSLFALVPAVVLIIFSGDAKFGLHPNDPVLNAPVSIKFTFLGLFGLMLILSMWIILYRNNKNQNRYLSQE